MYNYKSINSFKLKQNGTQVQKAINLALTVPQLSKAIADETTARGQGIALLTTRMNNFTTLPEGSTTGDAELADIRVGADSTIYSTAGEAVRRQVSKLSEAITDQKEKLNIAEVKNYAFAICDSEGKVALAVNEHGEVIYANQKSEESTENSDILDTIELSDVDNYAFAICDSEGKVAFGLDKQGKVIYADQNKKSATPIKQNGNYDAEINMFICYGQSWSTGYDAPAITISQRYDSLMLDTGIKNEPLTNLEAVATSFIPAVEVTGWGSDAQNQKVGETPVSAQMNVVKQLMESEDGLTVNDLAYQLLGTAPGMGSKTLAQLEKGTDYYNRLINQVQQANNIAAAMGKRLVVQAFSWVQGALGRTGDYAEALEQLRLDIDTDVKSITGQEQDVKCITWQSFIYNTSLRAKQIYNQYVGVAETYPNIICSGATYHLDNIRAANLHFTSESQDWLGAYFGVAYKRTIIDGEKFEPTKPIKASKIGKILYLKFNVPQRPLKFDVERLTEATNYGFNLYDTDGVEKTITEVAIISPDTVKIVCADDILSTDRLTYGDNYTGTYQWVGDNHGNLRDSQGDYIQYMSGAGVSLPLHNWCVIFDKFISELEG